jgi:hypothetical protein
MTNKKYIKVFVKTQKKNIYNSLNHINLLVKYKTSLRVQIIKVYN